MSEKKEEIIRKLLRTFSGFKPGFCLEGNKLVILDRGKALKALQYNSIDLLAFYVCDIEDEIREIFLQNSIKAMIYQVNLLKELERVTSILSGKNISFFVLKGFAMKRYYPADCIRPSSDIDIIIHPNEKYTCMNAFKEAGYELKNEENVARQFALHGELNWISPQTQISIECHWDLINAKSMRKIINFDPDFIFQRPETLHVEGIEINVLPVPIDLAYLIAHHVLHHQFKKLLWLADVLLILMTEEVDWKEFEDTVRHLRLERPVYYYLEAVIRIFGKESLEHLVELKNNLSPRSRRYFFFAIFNRAESIFRMKQVTARLRDHIFRNAFK